MVGNMTRTPPQLVSPEEAVKLSLLYACTESGDRAIAIADEYMRQTAEENTGYRFKTYFLYATLYEAGRVQGIREERQRRKPRVSTIKE